MFNWRNFHFHSTWVILRFSFQPEKKWSHTIPFVGMFFVDCWIMFFPGVFLLFLLFPLFFLRRKFYLWTCSKSAAALPQGLPKFWRLKRKWANSKPFKKRFPNLLHFATVNKHSLLLLDRMSTSSLWNEWSAQETVTVKQLQLTDSRTLCKPSSLKNVPCWWESDLPFLVPLMALRSWIPSSALLWSLGWSALHRNRVELTTTEGGISLLWGCSRRSGCFFNHKSFPERRVDDRVSNAPYFVHGLEAVWEPTRRVHFASSRKGMCNQRSVLVERIPTQPVHHDVRTTTWSSFLPPDLGTQTRTKTCRKNHQQHTCRMGFPPYSWP